MKFIKLFSWIGSVLLMVSCASGPEITVAQVSGEFAEEGISFMEIRGRNYMKSITIENGSFSDTLNVKDGYYSLLIGDRNLPLYLKNSYDLDMQIELTAGDADIVFKGEGSDTNSYIFGINDIMKGTNVEPNSYYQLDNAAFDSRVKTIKETINNLAKTTPDLDSVVGDYYQKQVDQYFDYLVTNYDKERKLLTKFAMGNPSPVFSNYENYNGGTSSLSDFKGKYVYIDVWATWCGPCKAEIPHLKALEADFHDSDIEFVSISVDKENAKDTWKQMIKDRALGGVQLFADNNFNSSFIQSYGINSIPRFLLIDPEGNIVSHNASRPSDPNIRTVFKELGL